MVPQPKSIDIGCSSKLEIKLNIDKMGKHVDKDPWCVDMPTVYWDQTKYDGRKLISRLNQPLNFFS